MSKKNLVVVAVIVDLNVAEGLFDEGPEVDAKDMTAKQIKAYLMEEMDEEGVEIKVWKKAAPAIVEMLPRSEG